MIYPVDNAIHLFKSWILVISPDMSGLVIHVIVIHVIVPQNNSSAQKWLMLVRFDLQSDLIQKRKTRIIEVDTYAL